MKRVLISACSAAAIALIATLPISGQTSTAPPLVITAYKAPASPIQGELDVGGRPIGEGRGGRGAGAPGGRGAGPGGGAPPVTDPERPPPNQ